MKKSVYGIVTDKIIAQLDQGISPWRKPWKTNWPINANSGRKYKGINPFLLMNSDVEYQDHRWLTYQGALKLNGKVRPGEKGSMVVLWIRNEDPDTNEAFFCLRYYTVFNVEQCDNLELLPLNEIQVISDAEKVWEEYKKESGVRLKANAEFAAYSKVLDMIYMPTRNSFHSSNGYYGTLFHEAIHSTGHAARLDRELKSITSDECSYSNEELVAEIGSSMLLATCGIFNDSEVANSGAYIGSWLTRLKSDRKLVVMAAQKAQKAADYILGIKGIYEEHPEG